MNDLLLLACLLDGPQHGYALKKRAGTLTGTPNLHNNVVYPLLKRFVENRWVSRRSARGERGQTRAVYALTGPGRRHLLEQLASFTDKEAASDNDFHLRLGLFAFLTPEARQAILARREQYLSIREANLKALQQGMDLGEWGGRVVEFRLSRIGLERGWIAKLSSVAKRRKVAPRIRRKS
jgi:DNA-binding PadR family transcriptional regulator